jgi:diguanylate cyclase (GGDEF)-like protein
MARVRKETGALRKEIDSLQGRFFQLLSITTLVMLALATGMALRMLPHLLWRFQTLGNERWYLPQLVCGLLALVGLLSWYVLQQRINLRKAQRQLIQELIRRETAERLAVIDPLTEAYNRRYIMRTIASEASRADRQNSKFAFLMIDIDGFKVANDSLGHMAGDRILRELAQLLQKTLRNSDVISRYGGDEFLVLLIDADEQMAARAVERVQEAVAKWNEKPAIKDYKMSISCGFSTYTHGADPATVLATADQAMYQTKNSADAKRSLSRSALAGR